MLSCEKPGKSDQRTGVQRLDAFFTEGPSTAVSGPGVVSGGASRGPVGAGCRVVQLASIPTMRAPKTIRKRRFMWVIFLEALIALLVLVLIVIDLLIYLPFFKVYEKQLLAQEEEISTEMEADPA